MVQQLLENLYLFEDTCHVYILKNGSKAILIDFGSGGVLEHLDSIGIAEITAILMTHHHRDQGQGLNRAVEKGISIWVPHMEKDLFQEMDAHWQAREIDNNYNMRQDRFSILYSVPIEESLKDYETYDFAGFNIEVIPTPGHTIGSISLHTNVDNRKVIFTGDLIAGPGKTWSMAATQWSYNGAEGVPYSILSLLELKELKAEMLLPSHGVIMDEPGDAIDLLISRYSELLKLRQQNPRLFQLRDKPYEEVTPHLLKNRTSMANSYILISESKKALVIDYGYDFLAGFSAGSDRASRRPWLYNIKKLKEQYGIEKIDVAVPTHFHDDHIAGFNLLRDVEGTEIWCPENFSDVLLNPKSYNLPCLWYDPIPVDKTLPLNTKWQWEEYEFELFEQSGHTLYAVAIVFEVDGKRVLAMGDQYQGDGDKFNYVYHNGFRIWDYQDSANLYQSVRPDIIVSGHWDPIKVTDEYLSHITDMGNHLEQIHRDLLPLETVDFGAEGFGAKISPYQVKAKPGESFVLSTEVINPFDTEQVIDLKLIIPEKWKVENQEISTIAKGKAVIIAKFKVTAPVGFEVQRERVAIDITVGGKKFGQQAEALISID